MSCNCNNKVVLPTIEQDQAVQNGYVATCEPCQDSEACESSNSEGSVVVSNYLDTCCKNEGVTLLARFGNRLSRFTGSGFIQVVKGKASLVKTLAIKASTLWHNWYKVSDSSSPILGDPLPFPYLAVVGTDTQIHGIRGTDIEDSSPIWDASDKQFTIKPLSENDYPRKGLLPRATALELVGYEAIAENGEEDAVRLLSTLAGEGIIVINKVPTVDSLCNCVGCDPQESFASVVTVIPFPDDEIGTYTVRWSQSTGIVFIED